MKAHLFIYKLGSLRLIQNAPFRAPVCLDMKSSQYHGYCIFVIFIQSLFFNHSEHKVLKISLFCLFCTQSAEHPKLPINAANAAVFHHLPPFLMKEPFKIFFEIQIRMLLL